MAAIEFMRSQFKKCWVIARLANGRTCTEREGSSQSTPEAITEPKWWAQFIFSSERGLSGDLQIYIFGKETLTPSSTMITFVKMKFLTGMLGILFQGGIDRLRKFIPAW